VSLIIKTLDAFVDGHTPAEPTPPHIQAIFDEHIKGRKGSVKLGCVFLVAYSVTDPRWNGDTVPVGLRGEYGDKKLANDLAIRHVTLHDNVVAFGENLGWKGNVSNVRLSRDPRFATFVRNVVALSPDERRRLLGHVAWRLHSSRVVPQPMQPLPPTYFGYARSLDLCSRLLEIPSEGHIQQFLVASFLYIHRRRYGHVIRTHHPHASDKFDRTAGDIEEFRDDMLVAAYEVTVRDDWKNRLSDLARKATSAGLKRYAVFAANVRKDPKLFPAEKLVEFVEPLTFDLAVVDLSDFFNVFCSELSSAEIQEAIKHCYQLLAEPSLSGRESFMTAYKDTAASWAAS
jgi:hypothetical protein